jgi:hypothetical protein
MILIILQRSALTQRTAIGISSPKTRLSAKYGLIYLIEHAASQMRLVGEKTKFDRRSLVHP